MTIAYELHLKRACQKEPESQEEGEELSIQFKCELGKRVGNPGNAVRMPRERRLEVWMHMLFQCSAELTRHFHHISWTLSAKQNHRWTWVSGPQDHCGSPAAFVLKTATSKRKYYRQKVSDACQSGAERRNKLTLSVTRGVSVDLLQCLERVGSADGGRLPPGILA